MSVVKLKFLTDRSAPWNPFPPPATTRIRPSVSSLGAAIVIAFCKVGKELVDLGDDRFDLAY